MLAGGGRFAPSPTGPLHLGSLLTATAAWLDARARAQPFYLRFDDLDTERNRSAAEPAIRSALTLHGLDWDGDAHHQSANTHLYQQALEQLAGTGRLFYCNCSRKDLAGLRVYPGTCRTRTEPSPDCAIRFRSEGTVIRFTDLIQGPQRVQTREALGDFVIRRRDGIFAYVLATAVDDGGGEIERVVRGRDLLQHTAAQLLLMDALGLKRPAYAHLPIVLDAAGQKLSKQTRARGLDLNAPEANLRWVLQALGSPASDRPSANCADLLEAARSCWSLGQIPRHDHQAPGS
jgi:glutamyl-Q tRNA(Asp) synthetase